MHIKTLTLITMGIAASSLLVSSASAHLPLVEPERFRNDNHFTEGGFAVRQVGECQPQGNDPLGFYCAFRVEDDWSWSNPADIINSSRVPQPGLPGEPGFDIACENDNDCPLPPAFPGGPPSFGSCIIPLGPTEGTCDLSAGSPRPQAGLFLSGTLVGKGDVEVARYDYEPGFGEVPLIAIGQVPACKENINVFPTVAWAGPLDMRDARTGELLFDDPANLDNLPEEVLTGLPDGYGLRVTPPASGYKPTRHDPRPGFYSGFGQSAWLYNQGTQIDPCIEDYETCLNDPSNTHFDHNDVFHVQSMDPVTFYALWWMDKGVRGNQNGVRDAAMVIGTQDNFTPGDFAALDFIIRSTGNGRAIHGRCTDPQSNGKADIHIEGPPECADGVDNDGDGRADYSPIPGAGDPECVNPIGLGEE